MEGSFISDVIYSSLPILTHICMAPLTVLQYLSAESLLSGYATGPKLQLRIEGLVSGSCFLAFLGWRGSELMELITVEYERMWRG